MRKFNHRIVLPTVITAILIGINPAMAVDQCGKSSASGNPYPCCDNNNKNGMNDAVDGNCTWWAWKVAKDTWGVDLPKWGDAKSWNDLNVQPINKSYGFPVFSPSLINYAGVGSIAVSDTLDANYGHVAWLTGISSSAPTVSEMLCSVNTTQPRSKTYSASSFHGYIPGLYVYEFWVKNTTIKADPNANSSKPNFDAQFKVTNYAPKKFGISHYSLAVHDSSGRFLFDMKRQDGKSSAVYAAKDLSAKAADGLDKGEFVYLPISYAYFNSPTTVRIVPKIKYTDGTWVELGYYTVTVTK